MDLFFLYMSNIFSDLLVFCFVQLLSHVSLFATPWTAARETSLSFTLSRSLLKLIPIESVMPSNHLILCRLLLSCPQLPQHQGSFSLSQLFVSGGQSIGAAASASVLPMNVLCLVTTAIFHLLTWVWGRFFPNSVVWRHLVVFVQYSISLFIRFLSAIPLLSTLRQERQDFVPLLVHP